MTDVPWWRSAVVYQIYPRSFADSDGDGIGDLRGIIGRVDHLTRLGVDVVWLSPIYPSPQDDAGYDISDYENVDSTFGTLADLDELIEALHERGHAAWCWTSWSTTRATSTRGSSSRGRTRTGPERDWYLWRPPRHGMEPGQPGAEPTNWSLVLLRVGVGARPGVRRVLPAPVRAPPARPELGEPAGSRSGLRDDAALGGARGRRLPDGRHQLHLEGRGPGRVAAGRDRDPGDGALRRRRGGLHLRAAHPRVRRRRCTARCSPGAMRCR